jgi:hypothetical protein
VIAETATDQLIGEGEGRVGKIIVDAGAQPALTTTATAVYDDCLQAGPSLRTRNASSFRAA